MRGLSLVAASGGHSSSRCAGLSLSRPLLLWSTGSRRTGSVIVAHGPSCSAACGILPRPGLEPASPALAGRLSTTAPPGKPCNLSYNETISTIMLWTFFKNLLFFSVFFFWHFNKNLLKFQYFKERGQKYRKPKNSTIITQNIPSWIFVFKPALSTWLLNCEYISL